MQPGAKLTATAEPRQRPPGAQERVLECVVRIVRRAKHPVAVGVQRGAVWLDEVAEGALVAAASTVEQPPVRSPQALRVGRLRRLLLGPDDDAVAAFFDRDPRVSPGYAAKRRAGRRVAFRSTPQTAVRLAVPISQFP
jgi:hypothetical protein